MIAVQDISKFLGNKQLFRGVSLNLAPGERVGLVGPNGAGKTTLFHLILGEVEPDSGSVVRSKTMRLGYLPQNWMPSGNKSVLAHATNVNDELHEIRGELESVQQSLATVADQGEAEKLANRQAVLIEKFEHLGGYDLESRAKKVLAGLGFREEDSLRSTAELSGGWAMRLELARLLLSGPDILLLDEPTNHLDLQSLLWLEDYLASIQSGMLIVSHDRAFLNRIVTRVLEIEGGRLSEYSGNYDDYLLEKAQRQEIQVASYRNQQDRIRQIERFIERNRYRKSTARRAQSRLKLLEKTDLIDAPTGQSSIRFEFPEPPRSGKTVLQLKNVSKSYGEHRVYEGLDLTIDRGDRVAFTGSNGAGKSTLLKMLAGIEQIDSGNKVVGHQVLLSYYAQYQWQQLRPDLTVLGEASLVSGDMPQSRLRSLLGAFLFSGDDVMKSVSVLSGGEKARLILCKILLLKPNVLLLDEPTNHLDIPSRNVLEHALETFPGTICFISHDRHFINAVANKLLYVDSGKASLFPGNFDDFQQVWKTRLQADESEAEASRPETAQAVLPDRQLQKRQEAELRNTLYRIRKPLQKSLEATEASLESTQSELDELASRLADPATYKDGSVIPELQKRYGEVRQEMARLTAAWEDFALKLEELEEGFWQDKAIAGQIE